MKILNVYPKDICVELEFRLSEVKNIVRVLDNSVITVSDKIEGSQLAHDYVIDVFYPKLKEILSEFNNGS